MTIQSKNFVLPILASFLFCACADPTDPATPAVCGNNIVESLEVCDGTNLNGKTCKDFNPSKNWVSGQPICQGCKLAQGSCTEANTPGPQNPICGNNIIEGTETCDGFNLNGKTCKDFDPTKNWTSGQPACTSCALTLGSCIENTEPNPQNPVCGNNTIEDNEICDGTNLNGKTCADFDNTKNWDSGQPACTNCALTQGTCKEKTTTTTGCGNNIIENDEICDGTNLGDLTCYDLDSNVYWAPGGKPKCSDDCTDILTGSCKEFVDNCGNGIIEDDEACEMNNETITWANGIAKTCQDYSQLFEWGSGNPGCRHCQIDRGDCEQKIYPSAKNNIQSCSFTKLEISGDYITAYGEVFADNNITSDQLHPQLLCGTPGKETYLWSIKSSEDLVSITEEESFFNQFGMTASIPVAFNTGTLACSLTVQSTSTNSTSYYSCPLTEGSPLELSSILRDDQYRTVTIEENLGNDHILAKWTFDQLPLKATNIDSILRAEEGTAKASATIQRSEPASVYTTYAGISDTSALASNGWASTTSVDYEKTPYWRININPSGYSNLKLNFYVAGSGSAEKRIAAAYKTPQSAAKPLGMPLVFSDKNIFKEYSAEITENISTQDLEIRIYGYGFSDANSTMRIDNVTVIGTPNFIQ